MPDPESRANTMNDLAERYKIPDEIMEFARDGILEAVEEKTEEATVEFSIPSISATKGPTSTPSIH